MASIAFRRRALFGLAFALISAAVVGAPAAAHPFGPPSTARISIDGTRVAISWLAAEDDWVALGNHLGAFADARTELTGEEKLQQSPAVRDYLLDRIRISQGGRPCAGQVQELERLMEHGARLTFECPEQVTELEITLTPLTDLNNAYRTVLRSDTPATPAQVLMFIASASTQRVRFSAGGGTAWSVVAVAAGTAVAVAGGAGTFLVRRRRRGAARQS